MTQSVENIKSTYPLPAYNYRVTVLDNDSPNLLGFSEVSGLGINYEPVTYKHGLSFLMGDKIIPGMRQPIRLTLKKGLAKNGDFLQNWFDSCHKQPCLTSNRRDIVIDLCDEQGLPVVRWKLTKVLPIKIETPAFTANSNEVAILSMELIAADLVADYHPT